MEDENFSKADFEHEVEMEDYEKQFFGIPGKYEKRETKWFHAEIKESDMRKALKGKDISEYPDILSTLVLGDPNPCACEAGEDLRASCDYYVYGLIGYCYYYYVVKIPMTEIYKVNEDGEFVEGSDYTYSDKTWDLETLEELQKEIER